MARPSSHAAPSEGINRVTGRLDVLGLGIIPFDILYSIGGYPGAGSKIDAVGFHTQGGGPVPNALVGLARLGYRTALIAAVGRDVFGTALVEELHRDKVDHRFLVVKDRPTAIATGYIERGSGRRTMVLYRDITVAPVDIKLGRLPLPRLVHLDGRDMPATMKLARWAKANGVLISFDIGSMRNDVSAVFPLVDHLVVADGYALPFTGCRNARAAIERLRRHCPGTIVVTEGIKGVTGLEDDEYAFQSAFRVKNVDTTGAGDAFHTGYLAALLEGRSLAERLRYGAATAALKCRQPGGRLGLPTRWQVSRFLASHPKTYA